MDTPKPSNGFPLKKDKPARLALILSTVLLAVFSLIGIIRFFSSRRKQKARIAASREVASLAYGLSEAEAASRRASQPEETEKAQRAVLRKQLIRENAFSLFNLTFLGLAGATFLLGDTLGALATLGVMLVNIALNVFQEIRAVNRLGELAHETRPLATVIREGKARSIEPNEIVLGDVLVIEAGDRALASGKIFGSGRVEVDESALPNGKAHRTLKGGDQVNAGSICLRGRAAYVINQIPDSNDAQKFDPNSLISSQAASPLQKLVDKILKLLLIVLVLACVSLFIGYHRVSQLILQEFSGNESASQYLPQALNELQTYFRGIVSIAFGIAPTSLFFMIVVNYVAGAADLARLGALVRRNHSVESLAQVGTLCFSNVSMLGGEQVQLEPVDTQLAGSGFDESRIRHILADYAHSSSYRGSSSRAITEKFTGTSRTPLEEAPFLSIYGWNGIVFNDADLSGVYILGEPGILGPYLAEQRAPAQATENKEGKPPIASRLRKFSRRFTRRSKSGSEEQASQVSDPPVDRSLAGSIPAELSPPAALLSSQPGEHGPQATPDSSLNAGVDNISDTKPPRENRLKKLWGQATSRLKRNKPDSGPQSKDGDDDSTEAFQLTFAYLPEIRPLHDKEGLPQLPKGLIPLCRLRIIQTVRQDAIDAVAKFTSAGVDIKIFSSDSPAVVASIARQLNPEDKQSEPLKVVSGLDLQKMDSEQFYQAVVEAAAFGDLVPQQMADIVQALRAREDHVAVVVNRVNDIQVLSKASLSIALPSASQGILGMADIVLRKDTLEAFAIILERGQRIFRATFDILRLSLVQAGYLLLLILFTQFARIPFPFSPQHYSIISLVTLSLIFLPLSIFAPTGKSPRSGLGMILSRFVIPASVFITTAALVAFYWFQRETTYKEAQLVVTYSLVMCGLMVALFARPPTRLWAGGAKLVGERRILWVVGGLSILYFLFATTRLAAYFFQLAALSLPVDYLLVILLVTAWALLLRTLWRLPLLKEYVY